MQAQVIEEVLDRVLGSKPFSRGERLRRFLEYAVREELAGNGSRLKEYQIGVTVFDRGADFDPHIDNIVRVEAADKVCEGPCLPGTSDRWLLIVKRQIRIAGATPLDAVH
jgi:hypothetical protein